MSSQMDMSQTQQELTQQELTQGEKVAKLEQSIIAGQEKYYKALTAFEGRVNYSQLFSNLEKTSQALLNTVVDVLKTQEKNGTLTKHQSQCLSNINRLANELTEQGLSPEKRDKVQNSLMRLVVRDAKTRVGAPFVKALNDRRLALEAIKPVEGVIGKSEKLFDRAESLRLSAQKITSKLDVLQKQIEPLASRYAMKLASYEEAKQNNQATNQDAKIVARLKRQVDNANKRISSYEKQQLSKMAGGVKAIEAALKLLEPDTHKKQ